MNVMTFTNTPNSMMAYQDIQAAVGRTTQIGSLTSPDARNTALYEKRRSVFNEAYRVLEPVLYAQIDQEEKG